MIKADHGVHRRQQILRSQGPAFREKKVVNVLKPQAGGFTEHIQRIQQFLQIDQLYPPAAVLRIHD